MEPGENQGQRVDMVVRFDDGTEFGPFDEARAYGLAIELQMQGYSPKVVPVRHE
ncbi:hypothetical protein MYRNA_44 [Mycobacterium phage Myrna]|uniref:Uncharacterized protein n=1 Tax=Mycobacterium phage Myrna TaxID=546805 RepID=B5LJ55_9CAUD|nr:gp44 [Mycobacterium phage Myrna]ACH62052.1 hypothetical protein MYRNA_44 [Mycobacterium phage Myrna]